MVDMSMPGESHESLQFKENGVSTVTINEGSADFDYSSGKPQRVGGLKYDATKNGHVPRLIYTKDKKTGRRASLSAKLPPETQPEEDENLRTGLLVGFAIADEHRDRLNRSAWIRFRRQVIGDAQIPLYAHLKERKVLNDTVFVGLEAQTGVIPPPSRREKLEAFDPAYQVMSRVKRVLREPLVYVAMFGAVEIASAQAVFKDIPNSVAEGAERAYPPIEEIEVKGAQQRLEEAVQGTDDISVEQLILDAQKLSYTQYQPFLRRDEESRLRAESKPKVVGIVAGAAAGVVGFGISLASAIYFRQRAVREFLKNSTF